MAECEGTISSGQKAAEFYTANSFLRKKTPSLEEMVKRLAPLLERECGPKEKQELLDMMRSVALAEAAR